MQVSTDISAQNPGDAVNYEDAAFDGDADVDLTRLSPFFQPVTTDLSYTSIHRLGAATASSS